MIRGVMPSDLGFLEAWPDADFIREVEHDGKVYIVEYDSRTKVVNVTEKEKKDV